MSTKWLSRNKTLTDPTSNLFNESVTKFEELERDLEDAFDSKLEDFNRQLIWKRCKLLVGSPKHRPIPTWIRRLHLGSTIVGNPNMYDKITDLIKYMIQTSEQRHPKTDFSPILNKIRPTTWKRNIISNSNDIRSNTNVSHHHQQLNTHQVQFERNNQYILNPNANMTKLNTNAKSRAQLLKSRKSKSNRKSKRLGDMSNDGESDSNSGQHSLEIDEANLIDPASISKSELLRLWTDQSVQVINPTSSRFFKSVNYRYWHINNMSDLFPHRQTYPLFETT